MLKNGLVHIYCGDGKGKTTAAIGLVTRAAGAGKRVLLVRFLKNCTSSELTSLSRLPGVTVLPDPKEIKFSWNMSPDEKAQQRILVQEKFDAAVQLARQYDLIVFDEACSVISLGFLNEESVLRFIREKPESVELVFTGRNPSEALVTAADYVSEIRKIKHPFDQGIAARQGIDE